MSPDDHVCLCFHVSRRKLENYVRIQRPKRASQLSECGGAGTGCGWCVPILHKIFEHGTAEDAPSAAEHAAARGRYIAAGKVREE